ncbi:MAG: hypothetical protein V3W44_05110 [Dehalococcoidales bacterium]
METFYSPDMGCWVTIVDGAFVGTSDTKAEARQVLEELVPDQVATDARA